MSLQVSRYLNGSEKGGFPKRIQGGGSNGTADTIWVGVLLKKTPVKLVDGKHLGDISRRYCITAPHGTSRVAENNDKQFCTGRTIVERFKNPRQCSQLTNTPSAIEFASHRSLIQGD